MTASNVLFVLLILAASSSAALAFHTVLHVPHTGRPLSRIASSDDEFIEVDGPKAQLLDAIGYYNIGGLDDSDDDVPRFGFTFGSNDNSEKDKITSLSSDLSGYVLPLEKPSRWTLLYTDAPDLLGFRGGPLSQLVSIQQRVQSSSELEIVLTYKPSNNIVQLTGNFLSDIQDDRLEQAVVFGYEVGSMNKVDLQLKGTRIEGSRFGNVPAIQSPAGLPLGGFSIVYNDGDLRIKATFW